MTATPIHYELPENLTATKFIKKLAKIIDLQIASHQYTIKTFYDSFDWRLYNADMVCEFNHSQTTSQINLIDRKNGEYIAIENTQDTPALIDYFPKGRLKKQLEKHLEMRALVPICLLPFEAYQLNILNKDKQTVLRIQVDEHEMLTNYIQLQPLKGHEKAVKNITKLLQNIFKLKPAENTVLNTALKQQGRKAIEYSSQQTIKLKPEMRADKAINKIYGVLLQTIDINEAGTIENIDSEFLNDFRAAARQTRAGLSLLKNTASAEKITQHADFFSWLGQITGPTRDLDVYLLNYKQYKAVLPITLREDFAPFHDFLKQKHSQAQSKLAEKLESSKYRKKLAAWEDYLKQPLAKKGKGTHANISIKELADQRIWKAYKRLIKEAKLITEESPAETLHELTKTSKKLRYLMEFFQNLYHQDAINDLLKSLKKFQTVLNDFQDYPLCQDRCRLN